MRTLSLFVAAAMAFGLSPFASRLGMVLGPILLVALGVLIALAASATVHPIALAGGALGALASGATIPHAPAIAGALLIGLCFLERSLRVRETRVRVAHVATAMGAGAFAGALSAHYVDAPWLIRAVVVIICAVVVALPLLIEADDPVAHALEELSQEVNGPARSALLAGARLRRTADESLLASGMTSEVRATWKTLLRLARVRTRLERRIRASAIAPKLEEQNGDGAETVVVQKLDRRIAQHVSALTRAYSAADTMRAAEVSLDNAAAQTVETAGESLEEASRTMVEGV